VNSSPNPRCSHSGRARSASFSCLFFALLWLTPPSGWSKDTTPAPAGERVPIQAELVHAIEAGKVRVGEPVYARVTLAWKNAQCSLREGAVLRGRVVSETRRIKGTRSEMALVFESGQCNGIDLKPLALTFAALLAPDPNRDTSLFSNQESPPLSDAVGLSLSQAGSGSPMRSMLAAAATVLVEPPHDKPPVLVMPGQVIGLGDIKLDVGNGPDGSSVLSSLRHNLRLESGARLVLVASEGAGPAGPPDLPDGGNANTQPTAGPSLPEAPEADACAVPGCEAVVDSQVPETQVLSAAFRMPVAPLGFAVPVDRAMYTLDRASTLSYLGPHQVLLTFNPHGLVARTSSEARFPNFHIVRALLVEAGPTPKVLRSADWRIHDAKQYLWPLSQERVLVHVGNELRIYGSDLKIERRLALAGPLAYLAVAPSSEYFAIGVIHERHTDSVHKELAEAENREPEEDVEVKVLDADFHALVTVIRSSREAPPILSNDGEIRVPLIEKTRWAIRKYTWAGQRLLVKQVESSCRPQVSTLPPNLLFVTGCDRLGDGKWYRVLRPDGKLVLKGEWSSAELGQVAGGIDSRHLFALGTTEMEKAVVEDAAFHSRDVKDLRVAVFSGENGRRVASLVVPDPLPTLQTFALSPDGQQVAVLANHEILFFPLPAPPGHEE
jgi:hypothetical protein